MKNKLKIIPITLIIVLIVLITAFDNRLKIVNYRIKSDSITNTVKLVLIADLHSCLYGDNQSELVSAIDNYNPHAVLFVGDIFDDYYINDNSNVLIENVSKRYKTYFVTGNHDWWSNKMQEHFNYLKKFGVNVLRGNSQTLSVNDSTIVISGVDDYAVNTYEPLYKKYEEQLKEVGTSATSQHYNVLLAHRPENVNQYLEYDFDLVLSGHTHGGQGRIPFLLNGFYAPEQGYFPKLAGGLYDFDGKKMIVSRGLSRENTEIPRIFNRPELVFVSLTSENNSYISLSQFPKLNNIICRLKVVVRTYYEKIKNIIKY